MRRKFVPSRITSIILTCFLLILAQFAMGTRAQAVTYQGTYAIINPYCKSCSTNDMNYLDAAAAATCPQTGTLVSPFCGGSSKVQPINGIYLKVPWCQFQLYNDGTGSPPQPCHYKLVNATDVPSSDTSSQCNLVTGYVFDTCSNSLLYAALADIVAINAARANAGLAKLNISVGLVSGSSVPLSYLLSGNPNFVNYIDQVSGSTGGVNCLRLPLVWSNKYISGYDNALDQLLTVINAYSSGALNGRVKIVKVTPITAQSNEFEMAGTIVPVGKYTDSYTIANQGSPLACPYSPETGASRWLTTYNSVVYNSASTLPDCNGYQNFAQATECVFASAIGHVRATLKNNSMAASLMNIPTTTASALPQINCGINFGSSCAVQAAGDQWSIYYAYQYTSDLFSTSTVAFSAASYAYSHNAGTGTFALDPSQISVEWTALQYDSAHPTANSFADASYSHNSNSQLTCALNNVTMTHAASYILGGMATSGFVGPGTIMGWQTQTTQSTYCSMPSGATSPNTYYDYILSSGTNGPIGSGGNGQFIEVQTDAAFSNLPSCAQQLTTATSALLGNNPSTSVCPYP